MIDHPRLSRTDGGEWALELSLEPVTEHNFARPHRETLVLSTRAVGLVVDDLGYVERKEVALVTAQTIVLTEGVSVSDEKIDPVDLVRRICHPAGGKRPTDREIERVAECLREAEIRQDAQWLVEELIEESRLSEVMELDDIRTRRDRVNGLRGIATDL